MNAIQLEFNVECKNPIDVRLAQMQQQLDLMNESLGKVRRSLFAKIGELNRVCQELDMQSHYMREDIKELKNEKTHWIYGQGDCLFDVRENQRAIG